MFWRLSVHSRDTLGLRWVSDDHDDDDDDDDDHYRRCVSALDH